MRHCACLFLSIGIFALAYADDAPQFLFNPYGVHTGSGAPRTAFYFPRPCPGGIFVPFTVTDSAHYYTAGEGTIAFRVQLPRLDLQAVANIGNIWISARANGEWHFVYKGFPEQRHILTPAPALSLIYTIIIAWQKGKYTCSVNGEPFPGSITLPAQQYPESFATVGRQSFAFSVLGAVLFSGALSAARVKELCLIPEWDAKMLDTFPDATLYAPRSDIDETEPIAAVLGGAPEKGRRILEQFAARQRELPELLYVDKSHPQANDQNQGDASRPFATISAAVKKAHGNTRIIVRRGMYPESVLVDKGGICIEAPLVIMGYPGEENDVVLTGADRVRGWRKEGDLWVKDGFEAHWKDYAEYDPRFQNNKPPYTYYKRWMRSWWDHLWINGQDLLQADDTANLIALSFTIDREKKKCYVKLPDGVDPNTATVEASMRSAGIEVRGSYVTIRGLRVEKFLSEGVLIRGLNGIYDSITTCFNFEGITFRGHFNIIRNVRAYYNGNMGISTGNPFIDARGVSRTLLEDCHIAYNNTKGITLSHHAGGLKVMRGTAVVARRIRAEFNRGVGIWFDHQNIDCVIEHCVTVRNHMAGIMSEVNHGPILIRNNVSMGNTTGILIAESAKTTAANNTCVNNISGIVIRYLDRDQGGEDFSLRDLTIFNNIMAHNSKVQLDASVWGTSSKQDPLKDPVAEGYRSDYNIFWNMNDGTATNTPPAAVISWSNQLYTTLSDWKRSGTWEEHSRVMNPGIRGSRFGDMLPLPDPEILNAGFSGKSSQGVDLFFRTRGFASPGAAEPPLYFPWFTRTYKGEGEGEGEFPMPD
ncbi:MAG: right-handed parallel beta-helix repeat-containing protein [Spirochaetota bacterium]